MKVKIVLMVFLALVLSGGGMVMAHGSSQMASSTSSSSAQSGNSMTGMDMSGKDKNMDMSGSSQDSNMAGMDMSGKDKNMDMSGSSQDSNMAGMAMGEKPIKETPSNIKVLGTFGAVNAAFIIIGIWNKWMRRKDGSYVSSK